MTTARKDHPMNRELLQFVMFGGSLENSTYSPPSPTGGPKDPPSDQSTFQDPNDEDVLDEGNPDEPDDDD
jgi:hypothetical protein